MQCMVMMYSDHFKTLCTMYFRSLFFFGIRIHHMFFLCFVAIWSTCWSAHAQNQTHCCELISTWWTFHQNPSITFRVILLTDRRMDTDRQTDNNDNTTSLAKIIVHFILYWPCSDSSSLPFKSWDACTTALSCSTHNNAQLTTLIKSSTAFNHIHWIAGKTN